MRKPTTAPKKVARKEVLLGTKREGPAKPVTAQNTKLEAIVALLRTPKGVTISDLSESTGWQAHSVRGALAGVLKKKGFAISSEKVDGQRFYRISG